MVMVILMVIVYIRNYCQNNLIFVIFPHTSRGSVVSPKRYFFIIFFTKAYFGFAVLWDTCSHTKLNIRMYEKTQGLLVRLLVGEKNADVDVSFWLA